MNFALVENRFQCLLKAVESAALEYDFGSTEDVKQFL